MKEEISKRWNVLDICLAEMGLLGFLVFFYLCLVFVRRILTGLLIHSASYVSWTVSKIAAPFWFLSGFEMVKRWPK